MADFDIAPVDPSVVSALAAILRGTHVSSVSSARKSDPDTTRHYLVTLEGVKGDVTEIYATLQDGTKTPIPATFIEEVTLVYGSFRHQIDEPWLCRLNKNELPLRFPMPSGMARLKRIWMRFPPTNEEQIAVVRELDERFGGDGFKAVPTWIRSNVLEEPLTPKRAAGWIELPWSSDRNAFERILPIDGKAWRELLVGDKKAVGERAILLYEFEGDDGARRIVKLDNGKYYLPHELQGWTSGLR